MMPSELSNNAIPCRYLDWDSEFWGCRVARIEQNKLTPETLMDILAWCAEMKIDLLYFLAAADDAVTVRLVETHGFYLTDVRLTLEYVFADHFEPVDNLLRAAKPSDIAALREIAKTSYRDARFYYDPHLARDNVDNFYATWIEKSCQDYADTVLVAEIDGQPAGFITCHRVDNRTGNIGLVGVHAGARGKGLGRLLIGAALSWFATHGMESVTVVTQARNIAAQRLYQRAGFSTISVGIWYHRWFREQEIVVGT